MNKFSHNEWMAILPALFTISIILATDHLEIFGNGQPQGMSGLKWDKAGDFQRPGKVPAFLLIHPQA